MAELTGQTFAGFEVVAKLGQGGMGAVYKARQISLNRFVALKVMSNALAEDQEFIERFKREATTAAQFKHPNIVQVHAAGESNGIYYMAMEFVEGGTLREHIRSHGRLDPQEAIAITLHVAEGLKYAWNKSRMIHRDIKPDNVFLSQSGEVLVGDLGLAKNIGGASTEMTSTGMMLGSPHYISPEQAMAAKDIDFRADIYSLGCTLYHMLTGRTAYEGDSSMVLLMKHVQEPPPDIFEALPECPRKLGVMVGRMMAKNRDERPSSYDELITGLWEANENLSGATEIGRPPAEQHLATTAVGPIAAVPTVAAVPGLVMGNRRLVIGGAVGAVVLLLAGLMIWSPWRTHTSPNQDSEWRNLIPAIDPKRDGISGGWKVENGKLLCAAHEKWPLCELPVDYKGGNYDLRFRVTRGEGSSIGIFFLFRKGGTGGVASFDVSSPGLRAQGLKGKIASLTHMGDKTVANAKNETRKERASWLPKGNEKTVLIQVRDEGVVVNLDGEEVLRWEGNWEDVTQTAPFLALTTQNSIARPIFGICVFNCEAAFSTIEIREVTGKGVFTRGTPSASTETPSLQHSAALKLLGNVFTNSVGAEMVYIPPGEFMMGSTKEEQAWALANGSLKEDDVKREGEAPRKATIKQGFWMGRTEVTVGQWKQFVKETGYVTDGEKKGVPNERPKVEEKFTLLGDKSWRDPNLGFELQDDHPMCCVSWNDSKAFCDWLTERERKAGRLPVVCVARLPTEAEWEYSCRAGTQSKYWWGENKDDGKGRLNWRGKEDGFEFVSPVDSFGKLGRNQFGLADMLGGVWEWCLDEYDATQAHEECYRGNPGTQVMRGGAFGYPFNGCRCAFRRRSKSDGSLCVYGFRVCYGVDVSVTPTTTSASPAAAQKEGSILAPAETRVPALTTNPKAGEVFTLPIGSNVTMELMGIPPGEFMLGSTKEEQAWALANGANGESVKSEGKAPRKAAIKHGFWMSRTEVTVGQWKQFITETGYVTDGEKKGESAVPQSGKPMLKKGVSWRNPDFGLEMKDNHPVCCISWKDAVAYCEWLTEQERKAGRLAAGMVLRLPTEAEWEYACRAGAQTKFWWGDSKEGSEGRLNWGEKNDGIEFVSPVDSYGARGRNRFGLADMLGSVYEWCLDECDATQAHEDLWTGNPGWRVFRGGSFSSKPAYCRCASRYRYIPSFSISNQGFRVVTAVDVSVVESSTPATSSTVETALPEAGILAPPETRVAVLTTTPKVGEVYTVNLGSNVTMELMGSTKE